MPKRTKAATPDEIAARAAALREAQAARVAQGYPENGGWAVHPAGEPAPSAASTTLGAALAAWAGTGTAEDFNAAFMRLTKATHPSQDALHRLARVMDDKALRRAVREMKAELVSFSKEPEFRVRMARELLARGIEVRDCPLTADEQAELRRQAGGFDWRSLDDPAPEPPAPRPPWVSEAV